VRVSVWVQLGVAVGVAVRVAVGLQVGVGVRVELRVELGVKLGVAVRVLVRVAVGVGVGEAVRVGEAGGMQMGLRLRNISSKRTFWSKASTPKAPEGRSVSAMLKTCVPSTQAESWPPTAENLRRTNWGLARVTEPESRPLRPLPTTL